MPPRSLRLAECWLAADASIYPHLVARCHLTLPAVTKNQ
jgi:hypothetical protein